MVFAEDEPKEISMILFDQSKKWKMFVEKKFSTELKTRLSAYFES